MKEKVLRNKGIFTVVLLLADLTAIQAASFLALYVRFDFQFQSIMKVFLDCGIRYAPINTITTILIFVILGLYGNIWKYIGPMEVLHGFVACILSSVFYAAGVSITDGYMPKSFYFFYPCLLFFISIGVRCSYRLVHVLSSYLQPSHGQGTKVMVIGAGQAGAAIIREYHNSQYLNQQVVCVIDDDPGKYKRYLYGCRVVGNRSTIPENALKYKVSDIVIAIPTLRQSQLREIVSICQKTDCNIKVLPGIYQLLKGDVTISKLRNIEIEDLLGRDSVHVNIDEIMGYVTGQVVLVTGGGGSIGSELCRQLAAHQPRQLIIVDIYENNAYDIQQELKAKYPQLDLVVLIASVRNTARMNSIFQQYHPSIVYHAAAHKHVPLMEESPNEAIKNNVFGTFKTARAAAACGVRRFVLISTDKAVNPTNIMGASKRICEMIVQMFNRQYETEFVAVRFGNVLGSNGSVIPLFRKQILAGGPVTVTHPEIIRYFMTIPEAVSLVLQAGAYARGGEIFIFDMGEPVKIVDLARNMIRLSGYIPDEEIEIQFTGLRPGEKLYEEMLMKEEGMQDTANHLIHIGKPIEMDEERFVTQLKELRTLVEGEQDGVFEKVSEIVPTYQPQKVKSSQNDKMTE